MNSPRVIPKFILEFLALTPALPPFPFLVWGFFFLVSLVWFGFLIIYFFNVFYSPFNFVLLLIPIRIRNCCFCWNQKLEFLLEIRIGNQNSYQKIEIRISIRIRNQNFYQKLEFLLELEIRNYSLYQKLGIRNQNFYQKLKIRISTRIRKQK